MKKMEAKDRILVPEINEVENAALKYAKEKDNELYFAFLEGGSYLYTWINEHNNFSMPMPDEIIEKYGLISMQNDKSFEKRLDAAIKITQKVAYNLALRDISDGLKSIPVSNNGTTVGLIELYKMITSLVK